MNKQDLSDDTEAVLLLCGRFGGEKQDAYQPLTPREYGEMAKWLIGRSLRPSDPTTTGARCALEREGGSPGEDARRVPAGARDGHGPGARTLGSGRPLGYFARGYRVPEAVETPSEARDTTAPVWRRGQSASGPRWLGYHRLA